MTDASVVWNIVLLAAGLSFAVYVLWVVRRARREVREFGRAVERLKVGTIPGDDVFASHSELGREGNQFVKRFHLAEEKKWLNRFDCDRAIQPISAAFRSLSGRPRALAGVLILAGLIVTLLNLQFSVHHLGSAFHELSLRASDNPSAVVQQAMGGIAESAQRAFLYSAIFMSSAAFVLLLAIRLHRFGSAALLGLARWASQTHDKLVMDLPTADLDSVIVRLSGTVGRMDDAVTKLEEFGEAISSAKSFGDDMTQASRAIASAVERLPTNISGSMVTFSGEVARKISESLDHHVQYLERLLVMYGDQKIQFGETHKFMADTLANAKATTEAVAPLASVSDTLRTAAGEIRSLARVAGRFERKTRGLENKIDGLPFEDIRRLGSELQSGLARLAERNGEAAIAQAVSDLEKGLEAELKQVTDLVTKADATVAVGAVLEQIKTLGAKLEQVSGLVAKADSGEAVAVVLEDIKALRDEVGRVRTSSVAQQSVAVAKQLERIENGLSRPLAQLAPSFWPYGAEAKKAERRLGIRKSDGRGSTH
jgi:hypothetical protein